LLRLARHAVWQQIVASLYQNSDIVTHRWGYKFVWRIENRSMDQQVVGAALGLSSYCVLIVLCDGLERGLIAFNLFHVTE